ncbi:helix-turn-helix transcriptional regulator [Jonquetella anthropi]|uniref:helix-turn-helix transcriptional regulator n=1 Tax=Jonquetella anthropi TaxID=428712 RepID=UPI0001B915CE|nr:helix-turn-helix transcriptional regulator [Jonquetella anthropi]EEX48650.1 DNA-binding helix-turn-helix protein [Jonquetella anthropi E3_33 E1]
MAMTRLKESRQRAGYTQKQVAQKLGITERAYQHYEAGTRKIPLEALKALSLLFNEAIDSLVMNTVDFQPLEEPQEPYPHLPPYKDIYKELAKEQLVPPETLQAGSSHIDDPDIRAEAMADCNEHNLQVYIAKIYRLMTEIGIDAKHFNELKSFLDYLRYLDR